MNQLVDPSNAGLQRSIDGARCLAVEGVSVEFGGLKALRDVTLAVPAAAITGLIGPNGAGKTTLINVLTGFYKPSRGQVLVDGRDLKGLSSHEIRKAGVSRTFQSGRLFKALTVFENVVVAGIALGMGKRAASARAAEILELVGIPELSGRVASTLAYTDQHRVAIARAIVGNPAYLLVDEPAAGMSERELENLTALIRRLVAETGCGILLIEHNIGMVLDICSTIFLLDGGAIFESGDPDTIRHSPRLREAYIGSGIRQESFPGEGAL